MDADACPVKDEVYQVAGRYGLHVLLAANQPLRVPSGAGVQMVVVDHDQKSYVVIDEEAIRSIAGNWSGGRTMTGIPAASAADQNQSLAPSTSHGRCAGR